MSTITEKSELLRKIQAVMDETGLHDSERMKLSRELDARGITPLRGGTWGTNSSKLGNFWRGNKHLLALDDERGPQQHTLSDIPESDTGAHTVPQERAPDSSEALEHESIQASAYADSIQENTEPAVSQEHTMSDTPSCETLEHDSTQLDDDHISAQSTTASMEPEPVPQESTESYSEASEMSAHNVIRMNPKDASDLTELLVWWRERRAEMDTMPIAREERPAFKRAATVTKTVRLAGDMALAAERYAHKHRSQTGGSFSGLCEWLIWQALGRPERFVTHVNTE